MRFRRLNIGILFSTEKTNSEGRAECGNSKHDTNRQRCKGDGTVNGIHCRLYAEDEYRSKQIFLCSNVFFRYTDIPQGWKPPDIHVSCRISELEKKKYPQKHICSRAAWLRFPRSPITCFRYLALGVIRWQKEIECKANFRISLLSILPVFCCFRLQRTALSGFFWLFTMSKIIFFQHSMYLIDIVLAYIIRYSEIHMLFPSSRSFINN